MRFSSDDYRHYTVVKLSQLRSFLVLLLIVLMSYAGWPPVQAQTKQPSATADAPLRTYAQRFGFYVGAAVNITPFRNEAQYTDTLKREFNMIVAENAFKFDAVHPSQNTYKFTDTDALVNFAEANGMKIRGHTLVWHSQLPAWVSSGNFTRDQAIAIMRDHINTMVGRYRGRIMAWDVVNEAIDDTTNSLRTNSFWYQTIGADYIEMAFRFAHDADPDAILYYNDYSTEGAGAKSDAVYNLMVSLKNKGVPVNGVGWQSHFVNGFRIGAAHHTNAQRLAALGLEVSLTEVDMRTPLPSNANSLATQATAYRDIIDFCMSEPNVKALVTWGFTDKYSWIPGFFSGYGDALIFDTGYQPKPSYTALVSGLKAVPLKPILLQFDASNYTASENEGSKQITVTRSGNLDPVTVDFVTSDGTAHQRTDYETKAGTLSFASGETSKTFSVLINDNVYIDGNRTINLTLRDPVNASLDLQSTATLTINNEDTTPPTTNPLDDARFFVRQHYYDFLNRTPDQSGLDYWAAQITSCNGNAACIRTRRTGVSAAYFIELEFQTTGSYVYRMYKASYGVRPTYPQFMPDRARINPDANQIEASKQAFADQFVQRAPFTAKYPASLSGTQFIDALLANVKQNSNVDLSSQRAALVGDYAANNSRSRIVRLVAEMQAFQTAEYNNAFVLMQYFGYLRRDPDDGGYLFWLDVLNNKVPGNFKGMVCAFITSAEYQQRFSPIVTRTDADCAQ